MPSSLDESAIRHIAHLSRLKVTDEEITRYAAQLSEILDYMDQLNELDTTGIEPTAHPLPVSNVFREDAEKTTLTPDRALANAPRQQDTFFQVPKVLDQESD